MRSARRSVVDSEVVAPTARRGAHRHRQDARARDDALALDRVGDLGRDAQSVGHATHSGRIVGGSAVAVATGMCGVALGSDGGGSIRYPSALTGLFGIKPQRDRISLGPDHHDAWNGLTVYGPLARTVRDAAAVPRRHRRRSTRRRIRSGRSTSRSEPLRIAVSFKPPLGSLARLGADAAPTRRNGGAAVGRPRSRGVRARGRLRDRRDVERLDPLLSTACSTTLPACRTRSAWSATPAASPRSRGRITRSWLAERARSTNPRSRRG